MQDILESRTMMLDIGGTPSNILGKTKKEIAYALGYSDNQMVAILDPFNLARLERILPLGESYKVKQIKFSVNVPNGNTDISSDAVPAPSPDSIRSSFLEAKPKIVGRIIREYAWRLKNKVKLERRYDELSQAIPEMARSSRNLREFMNSLSIFFLKPVKTILLEDIFSKRPDITYSLIERFGEVPARAICPKCNTFQDTVLGKDLACCNVSGDEIIRSGRFIPEEGFFPVLSALNGYQTFTVTGKEYIKRAQELLGRINPESKVAVEYPIQKVNRTAFENFLLSGLKEKNYKS